ncbi:MAG: type II secretion system F family protein [Methylococcales bacterium]
MVQAIFLVFAFAAGLMSLALWLLQRAHRVESRDKINQRWRGFSDVEGGDGVRRGKPILFTERLFRRAGIESRDWHGPMAIFSLLILFGAGWKWNAWIGLLLVPSCAFFVFYLWLIYRAQKRTALVLSQLPLFLDQVLRALATGRSMDGALGLAATDTPKPLKEIIERVLRLTVLGADLGNVLQETADIYGIKEWHLMAIAVKINRTYGSGVRELLQSVIGMIRHREASRRELSAMTGETRISAWVLGLLAPALAVYMMIVNPSYIEGMWQDPGGRYFLLGAVALQVIGAFMLWRMVKSV